MTVYIAVNGKAFSDLDLDLTNAQYIIFSYNTIYSNLMFLDQFLFESSCKNTNKQAQTLMNTL